MNTRPATRSVTPTDKMLFHKSYAAAESDAAEVKVEEDTALGGTTDTVLVESDKKVVVAMVIPEWFCATICAGMDLDDLFVGMNMEEEPQQPVPGNNNPEPLMMGADPNFIGDENQLINTGRFGVDPSLTVVPGELTPPSAEAEPISPSKDMNNNYKCAGVLPIALDCLEKGDIIAEWFLERMLNPKIMCDYNKGTCESLYA
mmetsp:Transcript_46761/g.39446  ORF Transcript_46761/g.39446 Transcript_46761/m.39446 type:complete len:202 (-) Transcript_46761:6-611(-)